MTDWWVPALVALPVLAVLAGLIVQRRQWAADPHWLAADEEDRPLPAVVVNPTKVDAADREQITAVCTGLGWAEPLWLETTLDDPGTGQAGLAVDKGADVVLACGGDGTVRAVAQALAGTGVAMGLVPAGTGNLLAKQLGTPEGLAAATRVALTGDDWVIDVGRVRIERDAGPVPASGANVGAEDRPSDGRAPDEQVFLVMTGTGFDAAIMSSTPEELKGRVGALAYVISGFRAMRGRSMRVTLTLDDEPPLRRRTRSVVVGNSGTLLGGLVLMPKAQIDDGLLDVVSIAPRTLFGWVPVALRVITRRRRGHVRVEHWQARSIRIVADSPQPSQVDGDPAGEAREISIAVEPAALVLRVPQATEDPGEG